MAITRANLISTDYTGPLVLDARQNRTYFFIVVTAGSITIQFGEAGGEIPLVNTAHYEPYVTPTSKITIAGTGTYTINEG